MAKLYFKYGAMGSSKTAQALITKFNYEERGMKVWLIKPSVDERDGVFTVKSRIGLTAEGTAISETCNIYEEMKNRTERPDVIIADEVENENSSIYGEEMEHAQIVFLHDVTRFVDGKNQLWSQEKKGEKKWRALSLLPVVKVE